MGWKISWRAMVNRLYLNPLSTAFYDWLQPASSFGMLGERMADRYLRKRGYTILARQYENKWGELDLIATRDRSIIIVEVKTRRTDIAGLPAEAVDANKQARITQTALAYLRRHDLLEQPARFDVIAILWPLNQRQPTVTHYMNAFEPVGRFQMHV